MIFTPRVNTQCSNEFLLPRSFHSSKMTVLFASWLAELYFVIIALFLLYYVYFKAHSALHWKKKNIPHLSPVFLLGNTWHASVTENFAFILADLHKKWKFHKMVGFWNFTTPVLLITDLEIVKNILTRDFSHFRDRGIDYDINHDPLAGNLFNVGGAKWRNLRVKLTPTFTSGKMKMMFPTMMECGKELQSYLGKLTQEEKGVEVKEVMARFNTDIISSCAFGIETNSLKNPNSEFRKYGKKIFEPTLGALLKGILLNFSPYLYKLFKFSFTPKDVSDFFLAAVKDTMEFREKKQIKRNDFMQLLIQLKNKGKLENVDGIAQIVEGEQDVADEGLKFTFTEAAAQAFVFFAAGFETSSTALTFALYELAINSKVQELLQAEIDEILTKYQSKITYESIMEMDYLDCVVQETLRKYPPVPFLFRQCNKEYVLDESKITIPEKTTIMISVLGIQKDPEHFPDPEKFDPQRFFSEERAKRHHFSSLPFGEGPRNCIGNRFGLLQTKVGLVSLLAKYHVQASEKTPIPLRFDKRSFVLAPDSGVFLRFVPRT